MSTSAVFIKSSLARSKFMAGDLCGSVKARFHEETSNKFEHDGTESIIW